MEEWRDIPDYEGLYQVSNWGRVKSLMYWSNSQKKYYSRERILSPRNNGKGYYYVCLYKNGKSKNFRINRLVAQSFIPNPDNLPEVNHIDEDKKNNKANNLHWCTSLFNVKYSQARKILQYDKQGTFIKEWESIADARRILKIYNIESCCQKKRKTAGNFIWRYANEGNECQPTTRTIS
jgi:hypothetical protein